MALTKGESAAVAAAAAESSDAVPETAPPGYLRDATYFRALGDARFGTLWADGPTLSSAEMMDDAIRYVSITLAASV